MTEKASRGKRPATHKKYTWLIDSRADIQKLLGRLYDHSFAEALRRRDDKRWADAWALMVGALFSLWRAVFLAERMDETRDWKDVYEDATDFLDELIATNAIGFPQESRMKMWTCGYYLNNAIYRINEVIRDLKPVQRDLDQIKAVQLFLDRLGTRSSVRLSGYRTRDNWTTALKAAEELVTRFETHFRKA